jgi:hypothetical protein
MVAKLVKKFPTSMIHAKLQHTSCRLLLMFTFNTATCYSRQKQVISAANKAVIMLIIIQKAMHTVHVILQLK